MHTLVRLILEKNGQEWSAWFAEIPEFSRNGSTPGDAVTSLLSLFTEIEFFHREIKLVEDAATENHLEFTVPYKFTSAIPEPSRN